jgi:hypothetical protein
MGKIEKVEDTFTVGRSYQLKSNVDTVATYVGASKGRSLGNVSVHMIHRSLWCKRKDKVLHTDGDLARDTQDLFIEETFVLGKKYEHIKSKTSKRCICTYMGGHEGEGTDLVGASTSSMNMTEYDRWVPYAEEYLDEPKGLQGGVKDVEDEYGFIVGREYRMSPTSAITLYQGGGTGFCSADGSTVSMILRGVWSPVSYTLSGTSGNTAVSYKSSGTSGNTAVGHKSSGNTTTAKATREFQTGASRDTEEGKLDFEGFLSPTVIEAYAEYMNENRTMKDGSTRDSDNWQKGMPLEVYMKSMWRHFLDVWKGHRELKTPEDQITNLCALLFNVNGMLHEKLKEKKDD